MSYRLPSIFITRSIHVLALGAFNISSASYFKYTVLALRFSYCVREWEALIPCQGTSVPLFILSPCPSPPSPAPATTVLLSASMRSAFQHSFWCCFQFFWREVPTIPRPLPGFPRRHEEPFTDVTLHAPAGVVRIPLFHQLQLSLGTLLPFPHLCSGSHHCLFLGRVSHCNPDWHGIGYVARLSLLLLPQPPRAGTKYEQCTSLGISCFLLPVFLRARGVRQIFFSGLCVSSHWDTFY